MPTIIHPPALLVTGANGFVGQALVRQALQSGFPLTTATRSAWPCPGTRNAVVGNIDADTDWTAALRGCNTVIHLAARVHVMHESAADPLAEFRRANVTATAHLARAAAAAGVQRLVYVSSIKVNGEATLPGQPFRETDAPHPQDAYARSKHEAEQLLWQIGRDTGLEIVIVRPPLVYGPGVKGNFARMLHMASWPLPLASVRNRRDLLAVDNLASALLACASHPAAANQTYLLSDGAAVSTAQLLRAVAAAQGRRTRLLPFPPCWLHALGRLTGQGAALDRLLGSLEIDSSKIRRELGWHPATGLHDTLARMAAAEKNPPG